MHSSTYQRWFGLLLGTLTGLAYTLVSQSINHLILPGVPLYQPPFGAVGNILMGTALGAVLGLVAAWPETGVKGVFLSSLIGALVITVATLLTGQTEAGMWAMKVMSVAFLFVPVTGALVPLLILFRWLVSRESLALRETRAGYSVSVLPRAILPVGLVLVAGALGITAQYNDLARAAMPRMHALIQGGLQAQNVEELPASLRSSGVDQFLEKGQGSYTLEWDKDDDNQYAIARPATNPFYHSTVIARFDSGYLLVCVFPDTTGQPVCKDF